MAGQSGLPAALLARWLPISEAGGPAGASLLLLVLFLPTRGQGASPFSGRLCSELQQSRRPLHCSVLLSRLQCHQEQWGAPVQRASPAARGTHLKALAKWCSLGPLPQSECETVEGVRSQGLLPWCDLEQQGTAGSTLCASQLAGEGSERPCQAHHRPLLVPSSSALP